MAINIRNPEAERLAEAVAKRAGETKTEAVTRALAAAALVALALSAGPATAMQGGGGMGHGQHGGDDGGAAGEGHGGHEGKGQGKGGHGGHDEHGDAPGTVEQACHKGGGMPPHYCAPSFKVMSSVPGLEIVDAGPVNDRTIWVKLGDLGAQGVPFQRNVAIVGGGGTLAGATVVSGGWQQQTTVRLALEGSDTVYGTRKMHLHAFPLTGP